MPTSSALPPERVPRGAADSAPGDESDPSHALYPRLLGPSWLQIAEPVRFALHWGLFVMAAGVLLSGLRDLDAALELPYGSWPWKVEIAAIRR